PTPTAISESGAKGMGEGGMIGAPACVLNAVNDALSGTGVSFDHIPVLPAEVTAALAGAGAGPAEQESGEDAAGPTSIRCGCGSTAPRKNCWGRGGGRPAACPPQASGAPATTGACS